MKVIFFGTPHFAAEILQFLVENKIQIVAVITKPDKPKGRSGTPVPTPVKEVAQSLSLPFFQPPIVSDPSFASTFQNFNPDLFIVVAYGEILKQHLLDMPRKGCINVHASLLPKYRGAAPIQHSILNGDTKTGITIMHMAKKMDAGDIITMAEVPIGPDDIFPEVEKRLCEASKPTLLRVIHEIEAGTATRTPQNHDLATLAPKIELEDCLIDWKKPAQVIHNLVRAVTPAPGAWCMFQVQGEPKRLKIYKTALEPEKQGTPGTLLSYGPQGIFVACGKDTLKIIELQLEGKKRMSAEEFTRGLKIEHL